MKSFEQTLRVGTSLALAASILTACGVDTVEGHGTISDETIYQLKGNSLYQQDYGQCVANTPYSLRRGAYSQVLVGHTATATEVIYEVWPLSNDPPIHFEMEPDNLQGQAPDSLKPYPDAVSILKDAGC